MIIKYGSDYVYLPGASDIVSPSLTLEDNKAGSLSFTILPTHSLYGIIVKLNNGISVLDDNGDVIFKGRAIESDEDFYGQREITCEGKLACLNDSLYRPSSYSGTVSGFLSAILTNHNSQVNADQQILLGTVSTDFDPNDYIVREWDKHTSSWELVKTRLVDELGGHLIMRYESNGDYLDYKTDTDMTTVSTQDVRLGENLTDLEQFIDATSLYTACIPIGAEIVNITYTQVSYTASEPPTWEENKYYYIESGTYTLVGSQTLFNQLVAELTALYTITATENTGTYTDITSINTTRKPSGDDFLLATSSMISAYGKIYAPISETTWDDVTVPLNLYNKAVDFLDNQSTLLKNEVSISFADLSKLGADVDDIRLYDKIHLISDYHGFNDSNSYRVLKVTYSLDAPETSSLTVGNTSLTLTDKTSSVGQKIENVEKSVTIVSADVANKEDKTDADTRFSQVNASITATQDQLSTRIEATEGDIRSLQTSMSSVEQRAGSLELTAQSQATTISEHGETITDVNQHMRFSSTGVDLYSEGSASTMHLDNDSLELKVNNVDVASFTQTALNVRNVESDNEVGFFDQWAIRKGAYITGKGNNLNDMWIGGTS